MPPMIVKLCEGLSLITWMLLADSIHWDTADTSRLLNLHPDSLQSKVLQKNSFPTLSPSLWTRNCQHSCLQEEGTSRASQTYLRHHQPGPYEERSTDQVWNNRYCLTSILSPAAHQPISINTRQLTKHSLYIFFQMFSTYIQPDYPGGVKLLNMILNESLQSL